MNFNQGNVVRLSSDAKRYMIDYTGPIGIVAGEYDPVRFSAIITVILNDDFKEVWSGGWDWLSWRGRGALHLDDLCTNKIVYNFNVEDLDLCETKLGNRFD